MSVVQTRLPRTGSEVVGDPPACWEDRLCSPSLLSEELLVQIEARRRIIRGEG